MKIPPRALSRVLRARLAVSKWLSSRIPGARRWIGSWWHPPAPEAAVGFIETRQWALDYIPLREGDDYALVLEYAEKRHEEMLGLSAEMDKKLDDLARTALAIGVLVATAARVLGVNSDFGRSSLLTGAVVAFAASVLVAVWARRPTIYTTPMEIRGLLKVVDHDLELSKNKTMALLAASYHYALVGTNATNA